MHEDIQIPESVRLTIMIATLIFLLLGAFLIFFLLYFRNSRNKHILERENLRISTQRTLLSAQLEIQEQTLKNISQEIHDNIGQVLSLAKLNLATTDIDQAETARQKINDSKNLVAKAIHDLRDLSKSLNTEYVTDMGLAGSIKYELEMIKKIGSFDTGFEIEGDVYKLEQQKELILFRMVQEVLNNVIKHARASRITVKLDYLPDHFSLKVTDNGQGFDLSNIQDQHNTSGGLGIKNMHNRALLIGGQLSITSTMSEGTLVAIRLPIPTQIT